MGVFVCVYTQTFFFSFEAVPSEVDCEKSQEKVMEAVGKMIHIIETKTSPDWIVSAVEMGKSILAIIGADHSLFPELNSFSIYLLSNVTHAFWLQGAPWPPPPDLLVLPVPTQLTPGLCRVLPQSPCLHWVTPVPWYALLCACKFIIMHLFHCQTNISPLWVFRETHLISFAPVKEARSTMTTSLRLSHQRLQPHASFTSPTLSPLTWRL